jgi:SAM-dependent methyltransferase
MNRRVAPFVERARSRLQTIATHPRFRRLFEVADRELRRALGDDVYDGAYFGLGRDPTSRGWLSGYERYDRRTSNADVAAYLLWRYIPAASVLDVGSATGFVVEALREIGVDAQGVDVSRYAVANTAPGARGHVRWGDLRRRLPFADGAVELVTALETLEHLTPTAVPAAISELARVARCWVVCTIPSFGPNRNGPGGWYQVKVRDDRVSYYESLGPGYEGPIPEGDLYHDAEGKPIEGHLTVASFAWWTARFADAGLVRCDATERRVHPELARMGMTKYWNLYVFRHSSVPEPDDGIRSHEAVREMLERFGLTGRVGDPEDLAAVRDALAVAPPPSGSTDRDPQGRQAATGGRRPDGPVASPE